MQDTYVVQYTEYLQIRYKVNGFVTTALFITRLMSIA